MIELEQSLSTVASYSPSASADTLLATYPPEGAILMDSPEARVRLSYSTLGLLHGCERKFQKTKLLHNPNLRDESPATVFGSCMGAAWQLYFVLRSYGHTVQESVDSALFEAFINYWPILEDDRRFQERAYYVMMRSVDFLEGQLKEWEIAIFNGKPATELSFNLNIDSKYYFVGAIDLVLRHRVSRRYGVVDVKTTSMNGADLTPAYKFSDQTLGYTIVVDKVAGEEVTQYDTVYWVCQLLSRSVESLYQPVFHNYVFPKTLKDRFDWFLKVYIDVSHMQSLSALNSYPKRGHHCMAWGKTCLFFNECQFTSSDRPAIYIPDEKVYDFTYELNEVLEDHNRRLLAA